MNPNLGMPTPQIGMVNSMPQPLAPPMQVPGRVGPNNTGGIFGALPEGMDWQGILQMLQQQQGGQQGQGQQAPQHMPLLMPQMNAPQFQMSPLSGLFGLHRGV